MAPNGNLKARNGAGVGAVHGKPPVSRRVVPAIPITYERRARANAAAKLAAAQAQAAPVVFLPQPATTTNGTSLDLQSDTDSTPPTPKTAEPEGPALDEKLNVGKGATAAPAADVSGQDAKEREDEVLSEIPPQESSKILSAPSDAGQSESTDKAPDQIKISALRDAVRGMLPVRSSKYHTPISQFPPEDQPQIAPFRPPPVIPPTRYNMPPGAHNASRPSPVVLNGTSHRAVPRSVHNGPPPHMHGPRPSNGSLVQFGGFASNSSSPAPPHSGGFMPPPGAPLPDARQFAAPNGYHPQMPYGTEFVPGTAVDQYGRPLPAPPGMEQYHPYANGYGPSTPHSFQGSHSSVQADDAGPYSHFPAPGIPNGTAHVDDVRSHPPPAGAYGVPPQPMMPGPIPPPHMMHPGQQDHGLDALIAHMRSQFRDTSFADCTLELRYLDDRAPPVRIPGHRVVLSRSEVIRHILETETFESSPPGANRTILLQSDDKYLRSDAFWMAIQHIYAFPLLRLPDPGADGGLSLAGSDDDRFDFALGYAAAGHVLGWHDIVVRGLGIASQSLSWSNIERAIGFCLGDIPCRASIDQHTRLRYGEPVGIMISGIIHFLINNFPPDFTLDTSVADPEGFARLPSVPAPQPAHEGSPSIAFGVSGNDRRSRPMHIQFGDLALGSETGQKGSEPAPLSPQQQNIRSTLSAILINLPFNFLKIALESTGFGDVISRWASVEARHQIMRDVINEREARRARAVEAVKAGAVPQANSVFYSLQSTEAGRDEWTALGWQEDVVSYINGDAPSLDRRWVPLMVPNGTRDLENTSRPAYP
ncbi:hypothetical protein CPLU01_07373 [Colletotrichum plurivorum]|uniref:Uncharacterized protein n=1 Tax=Colletotrichum plurivorum TaxID=2175906 RepID=A0A8H6NED4_9PEZI|nr:hypothetical protein CPLU01_07373 [Colletotrichum plurivorum]